MARLTERVAIVTGGGGGLGKDISLALAREGAKTVLAGRRGERLEAAAREITDAGGSALAVRTDVTREDDVVRLFERAMEAFGRVDILVNNAGTGSGNKPTVEVSLEEWQSVLATNLTGPFLCAREAMKIMIAQRGGRIINIGSISAKTPRPNSLSYSTTKLGLEGLTRSLCLDGRPFNIAASIIHLGATDTLDGFGGERLHERLPGAYRLRPADVAEIVVNMVALPERANVFELTIMPVDQPSFIGRG